MLQAYIESKDKNGEIVGAWFSPPVDEQEIADRLGTHAICTNSHLIRIEDESFDYECNTLDETNHLTTAIICMEESPLYYEAAALI